MFFIAAGAALALVACVIWVGRRTGALGRTAALALAALAVVWIAGFALISTGWNDVDGFVDCNDYCHDWHYLGGLLFLTPPIAGLLLVFVLVAAAVLGVRARARRGRSRQGT